MGDKTGIQWTDMTWNPVRGCRRVSKGCEHCYAEKTAARFSGPGKPYEGLVTLGKKGPRWTGKIMQVLDHLDDPIRKQKPRYIFVNSMSDLFFESLPNEYIASVFGVMAVSRWHKFQVLTKRPQRMLEFFEWMRRTGVNPGTVMSNALAGYSEKYARFAGRWKQENRTDSRHIADAVKELSSARWWMDWPLRNVHLGVSVEDQDSAHARIPLLLQAPAAIRWVSYEPAIGPVDFSLTGAPDWIVVGGESGPGARPFHLDWARESIAYGRDFGVPIFVKQLGKKPYQDDEFPEDTEYVGRKIVAGSEYPGLCFPDKKGGTIEMWPQELRVREWPEAA